MSVPKDAVAVDEGGRVFFYYVKDDGTLAYLAGPPRGKSEALDRKDNLRYDSADRGPFVVTFKKDGEDTPVQVSKDNIDLAVIYYPTQDGSGVSPCVPQAHVSR